MKLDPDLVRELLLWAERELPSDSHALEYPVIQGYDERSVSYHCLIATEGGFFDALKVQTMDDPFEQAYPQRLTYKGHQYLETIRDPVIWQKTKEGARKIGSFGLDTLAKLAVGFIETEIKKRTGYELGN